MKRADDSLAAIVVFTSSMLLQLAQTAFAFVPVIQRPQQPVPTYLFLSANIAPTNIVLEQWKPRSRYWKDLDIKGPSRNELAEQMGLDIQEPRSTRNGATATSSEGLEHKKQPTVKKLHRNKLGHVIAVEITCALSETQASRIQTMAASIRNSNSNNTNTLNHYNLFEHRSFGTDQGGNDCTYLAPLLQLLMPEIAQTVVSIALLAWEEAGWCRTEDNNSRSSGGDDDGTLRKHPNPMQLGIRTSEHLSYDGWRSLEPHKDVGSIYTCNIALRDPDRDFSGGEFFLQTSFLEQTEVKPERLSAIVFLSDTTHGVRPITSGSRVSFVTEFWNHDDAPLGMNRPTPNQWEEFLQKQK